jgi:hypothetical protein
MTISFPFNITQVAENTIQIAEGDFGIKFPEVKTIEFDKKVPLTDRQKDLIYDSAFEAVCNEFVRQLIVVRH